MARIKKPSGKEKRKRSAGYAKNASRILIVCEGAKTEKLYFDAFPKPINGAIVVRGTGYNTVSLVNETKRLRSILEQEYRQAFTAVWCVFDRDSFSAEQFNNALQNAELFGFEVAYTNEAFELWYLLHFDYRTHAGSRADYEELLSTRLGFKYDKANAEMYAHLQDRQPIAIQNATRLYRSKGNRPNPEKDNPITRVHVLVEALNDVVNN